MKVALIAPLPLVKKYGEWSDYHLVLAHFVLKAKKYAEYYRQKSRNGEHIILDNSSIELGHPLPEAQLRKAADLVEPTEIVVPDYLGDHVDTLKALKAARTSWAWALSAARFMFIPQGSTLKAWMFALGYARAVPEVWALGVPKYVESHLGVKRPDLVEDLYRQRFISSCTRLHLFGVHRNPIEILRYAREELPVRGIDMKFPFLAAQYGLEVDSDVGLDRSDVVQKAGGEPHLDFTYDKDTWVVAHNVKVVLEWAKQHDASMRGRVDAESEEAQAKQRS